MSDILSSLKSASGFDIPQVAEALANARVAGKRSLVETRAETAETVLSGMARLKSGVSAFREGISALLAQTSLGWQVQSPNARIVPELVPRMAPQAQRARVEVLTVAREQVVTSGVFQPGVPLGSGSLTLQFGTRQVTQGEDTSFEPNLAEAPIVVHIAPGRDALADIAAAVNAADPRLQAAVVRGDAGAQLVVRGPTGAAYAMQWSSSPDDPSASPGLPSLVAGLVATQASADASVTIDGISVTSPTNKIAGALSGLQLDVTTAVPGDVAAIDVALDTSMLGEAVRTLTDRINALHTELEELARPALAGAAGGPLAGEPALRALRNALRGLTTQPLITPDGSYVTLAEMGVRTNRDGSLSVEESTLAAVLERRPAAVAGAFYTGFSGQLTGIVPLTGGRSAPGMYALTDIAPAMQASAQLSPPESGEQVLVTGQNAFRVKVDGVASARLTVATGSYASPTALAEALVASVNADPTLQLAGRRIALRTDVPGQLELRSATFGSASRIELLEDTGIGAALGLAIGDPAQGTDAAGAIDGSPARGRGTMLDGPAGMLLQIRANAASTGQLVVARGAFDRLDTLLAAALAADSPLTARTAYWRQQATEATAARSEIDEDFASAKADHQLAFARMDALVRDLNSTGSFLKSLFSSNADD